MRLIQRILNRLRFDLGYWRVLREERRKCDLPGPSLKVGDRVQAVDHWRVDNEGGYGEVVEVSHWREEIKRYGVLVRFDSMPKSSLFMAPAELRLLDRKPVVTEESVWLYGFVYAGQGGVINRGPF